MGIHMMCILFLDEYIPPVLHADIHSSHCCYKSVPYPDPGDWVSVNVTSFHGGGGGGGGGGFDSYSTSGGGGEGEPFCLEPDNLGEEAKGAASAEPGWPGTQDLIKFEEEEEDEEQVRY